MINYKFILLVLAVVLARAGRVSFLSNVPAEAFAFSASRTGELIESLSSSNERSRINAALRLSGYDSSEVVLALIDAAGSDSSETVRRVALRSLGVIGDDEALDVILSSFESSSAALRAEALSASVRFSSRAVSSAVAQMSSDSHPAVRQKAMEVLGKVEPFTDKAKAALMGGLGDRSEGVRIAAINSAAERQAEGALSLILAMLEGDSSKVVRRHAAKALFNFGEKDEVVGGLRKGLKDSAEAVRVSSALALAKLGSSAGLNAAIEGINSSEARIREDSCMVFAHAGNEKSLIFLERALDDVDSRVRRAARDAVFRVKERLDEK